MSLLVACRARKGTLTLNAYCVDQACPDPFAQSKSLYSFSIVLLSVSQLCMQTDYAWSVQTTELRGICSDQSSMQYVCASYDKECVPVWFSNLQLAGARKPGQPLS